LARRRNLFLAVKEALNNVIKHSGASEVLLQLKVEKNALKVAVEDNGKGFEPAAADPGRHGLSNMAQRLHDLAGQCRVRSQPGAGCRVELEVKVVPLSGQSVWWRLFRSAPVSPPKAKEPRT